MSRLLIRGGNRLQGEVTIQGAKNSVLPILAATILTGGSVELRRCPRLRDVEASIRILQALGCKAGWRGEVLEVDTAGMSGCDVPDALMREMRSSVIFLGAILARCGEAVLTSPGGCELGPRPIDLHLSGLRALGAEIDDTGGTLPCKAAKLTGREIVLGFPSVGATENLMLAACGAEGVTALSNAAREPEIEDLQSFLNTCGAAITGAGTSTVVIRGGRPLHGGTYTILPDRIAAATYLCGAASAGGEVFLRDAREEHLSAVTAVLREAGCNVTGGSAGIVCRRTGRLTAPRPIRTAPYPGFPTDAQAILMAALLRCLRRQYAPKMPVEQLRAIGLTVGSDMPFCVSGGTALAEGRGAAVFEENLFSSRYRHVDELARMGADIRVSGRTAVVLGVERLHGAAVRCTDLRGGAALCAAALAAEGETSISDITHIDRGYQSIEDDLAALGADIRRVEETASP